MKAKAYRVAKNIWGRTDKEARQTAAYLADHMANCSCFMCANPRKVFNDPPVSEKRENERTKEQLHGQD